MKNIKLVISISLLLITIFLGSGTGSAAIISVDVEPHEVHVGDTVTLHVRIQNPDPVFYSNILVLFPWPNGLKYEYRHGGGISNINWSTASGIWSPGNMRAESRGQQKNLWIIGTVTPRLENKTVKITGRYLEIYDQGINVASRLDPATPDYLTVLSNNTNNGKGNGTGNGTGPGNGNGTGPSNGNSTGNEDGDGIDFIATLGNSKLASIINNSTGPGNENNPLLDLKTGGGGGGNGKSYELINTTRQNQPENPNTPYAILGILIVIALILAGYFKGLRK
ncbi:hypothetical protein [Methanobacterium sp.]|uniref:hypothetical protein n=1 Tax=Methanobacterium sp. TaxID=2164 RepID=UPI003C71A1ED